MTQLKRQVTTNILTNSRTVNITNFYLLIHHFDVSPKLKLYTFSQIEFTVKLEERVTKTINCIIKQAGKNSGVGGWKWGGGGRCTQLLNNSHTYILLSNICQKSEEQFSYGQKLDTLVFFQN